MQIDSKYQPMAARYRTLRACESGCENIIRSILGMRKEIALVSLLYIIYNINMRGINSGDTWPAAMLPFAMLSQRTIYLDMFANFFQSLSFNPYMVILSEGHYLSFYPIVIPVLITPLYAIPYLLLNLLQLPLDMLNTSFYLLVFIMEKLFASLIAVTSVVFCFLGWKEIMRREIAYICAVIYALATNTWVTSSQALWQQGMVELIISILMFLIIVNEKNRSDGKIIFMGVFSGLFIFNRPSDSLLLLPVLTYALYLGKKSFLYYLGSGVLSGLPFLAYNLFFFQHFFGGYANLLSEFTLSSSFMVNLGGLLISPSRGMLIFSPILLLSLFAYPRIKDIDAESLRVFLYMAGISILLQLIVYGCFRVWWAGHCYGPRFLVCLLPFLVTYVGLFLNGWLYFDRIRGKDVICLALVAVLLIWSIFVQAVGAFCYPNGNWDGAPKNVDLTPDRLWDWNDNQISRSLHSGPIIVNPIKIFSFFSGHSDSHQINNDKNRSIGWSKLDEEGIIGGLKGYGCS